MSGVLENGAASSKWAAVGVTIYIASTCTMAVGIVCQKHAANMKNRKDALVREPTWIFGFACWIAGSIGMGAALGFAPLSLLSPLRATMIVVSALLGRYFLKEKFGSLEFVSTAIITAAVAVTTAFADKYTHEYTASEMIDMYKQRTFIIFVTCIFAAMFVLYGLNVWGRRTVESTPKSKVAANVHNFTYGALAGIFGGCCSCLLKSAIVIIVSETKTHGFGSIFTSPLFWVLLLFLAAFWSGQIFWINKGILVVDAVFLVPVETAADALTGVVGGLFYFREIEDMKQPDLAWFTVGIIVTLFGLFLISTRTQDVGTSASRMDTSKGHTADEHERKPLLVESRKMS